MKELILFIFLAYSFSLNSTIRIIGDSHAIAYLNNHEKFPNLRNIKVQYAGPITMHRIGRDQFEILDLRKYGTNENDIIVFVFGEIDTRCHIGKIRDEQNKSLDEIIETLTDKYFEAILKNIKMYSNVRCIISGVAPPTNNGFNSSYPRYGTIEDRIFIVKKLNSLLFQKSQSLGIGFIDSYTPYANPDGTLDLNRAEIQVHIDRKHNEELLRQLERIIFSFNEEQA